MSTHSHWTYFSWNQAITLQERKRQHWSRVVLTSSADELDASHKTHYEGWHTYYIPCTTIHPGHGGYFGCLKKVIILQTGLAASFLPHINGFRESQPTRLATGGWEEYLQNESNFQQREHHHSPADFIQCELKMQGKFSRRLATEGLGHHGARGDVVKHSLQSFRSEAGT